MITIDIRNTFSSASWELIYDELLKSRILRLLRMYLSRREIVLKAEGQTKARKVNRGIPQGSILGPTLGNVLHDGLLRIDLPEGAHVVGFADSQNSEEEWKYIYTTARKIFEAKKRNSR